MYASLLGPGDAFKPPQTETSPMIQTVFEAVLYSPMVLPHPGLTRPGNTRRRGMWTGIGTLLDRRRVLHTHQGQSCGSSKSAQSGCRRGLGGHGSAMCALR